MLNAYEELEKHFQRLARIEHAMTFLQWDQLVMMPPGGSEARARAIAELAAMHHERLTAPQLGELIGEADQQPLDTVRRRSLLEMVRVWRRAVCLSADLVKAKSLAGSKCENGWRTQRRENDWRGFLGNFREVVDLAREEARARRAAEPERFTTPYDALLDLYCTGDDSDFIRHVFTELKRQLPELLDRVPDRQPEGLADLAGTYPLEAQERLNRKLMTCLGFDFNAGRLDVSLHPFSTGDRGDHRITTRFRETGFVDALMATAHETGHAAYESGLPAETDGLPVGRARNLCLHESQSLLFEKHLFQSRSFIDFFAGQVRNALPSARKFSGGDIWSASAHVTPGLIRIEADEVTYPLHVILRFEIERDLINAALEPVDIPEIWDEKMQAYLGLSTRGNDTDGCLQDIHWTDGSFGYFPSYTIGALNAAQLFAAIRRQYPDWPERLGRGEVSFVRDWLEEKVWRKGASMDSQEIMREATGETTGPAAFLEHLHARYLDRAY